MTIDTRDSLPIIQVLYKIPDAIKAKAKAEVDVLCVMC